MKTKRLSPMDASWLYVESHQTPMHVGGLMTFELPKDAPADFFQQLVTDFREHREFHPQWRRAAFDCAIIMQMNRASNATVPRMPASKQACITNVKRKS